MSDLFEASLRQFRTDMMAKKNNVERSLVALKNKDGSYAADHRRLLSMYEKVLVIIDTA